MQQYNRKSLVNSLSVSVTEEPTKIRNKRKIMTISELIIIFLMVIISGSTIFLFILALISLRLRNKKWKDVGFKKPDKWSNVLIFDIIISILIVISLLLIVLPVLNFFTGRMPDLASFSALKEGGFLDLLGWLALTWTLAAFGEELVYRGYIQNRIVDLVGDNRSGWIISVLTTSALFGLVHAYQGIVGIITTFLIAIIYSGVYLRYKRNLWASIIVHGFYDTLAFLGLYLLGDFLGLF
ncbi:MAG: CPBP family intramembrane glutamic endopeptidase [Candidatus Hodarchaeales archaeon]